MKAAQLERQGNREMVGMACVQRNLCLVQGTLERHGCPAACPVGKGRGTMDEPDLLQLAFCLDYIAQCREGIDAASAKPTSDRLSPQESRQMRKVLEEAERITVRMLASLFQEETLDE